MRCFTSAIESLKLALSVFMNEDVRIARSLIEEKTQLRLAELGYAESHLARLRDGRPESIGRVPSVSMFCAI